MDVLTVECLKINDLDFKGLVTFEEARVKIFMHALGLPAILLHSIKMNYVITRGAINCTLFDFFIRLCKEKSFKD